MTDRELNLRQRIDTLTDERDAARALAARLASERRRSLFGWCCLCGTPCTGRVCPAHREILLEAEAPLRQLAS